MDLLYHHGPITKERCEELLGAKGKDGAFLIRDSETIHGAMCLCVYKKKVVYTYRILQTHTGYYTLQSGAGVKEKFFKTLEDLVHHYKKRNRGLATRLRCAVKRKQTDQESVLADEEPDYENVDSSEYENVDSSDYVDVLPD
ncbi:SH2 domain-containing protein 1B [Tachysurus vachellii]|uniref:SH2 domain-containing protein 1B n=1 Tax=Tachysurus vachellii TaxID=175792 RepID=UPI00296B21C8|nr:SH2 domain-containing protein 1B [Tachysurus vachellii]